MNFLKKSLWLFLLLPLLSTLSHAANTFSGTNHKATLISDRNTLGDSTALFLGVHFKLKDTYKTYWKYPGAVGEPLEVNWKGSKNIKSVEILWPTPTEFTTYGLKSYGYGKEVLFPLRVEAIDPSKPVVANLELSYFVCNPSSCTPHTPKLSLTLKAGGAGLDAKAAQSKTYQLIQSFLSKVPRLDSGEGLTIDRIEVGVSQETYHPYYIYARDSKGFEKPELFIEITDSDEIYFISPEIKLSYDKKEALFFVKAYRDELKKDPPSYTLAEKPLSVTISNKGDMVESIRPVDIKPTGIYKYLLIILFAFLGGVILNIMPCVLPVLSIKVISIFKADTDCHISTRKHFFMTFLGILASFWVIATMVVLLKQFGFVVGWGVQFQYPLFLVGIIIILTLFSYNLLGLFEFNLSPKVGTALTNAESTKKHESLDAFLSGAFVTTLATPCTAPFLGTALSFALSRGLLDIFLIFTVMGLGLGLPYILVSIYPNIAKIFPKPGNWMVTFKKLLSIPLFATVLWLLWTLSAQKGLYVALAVAALMVSVGVIYWVRLKVSQKLPLNVGIVAVIAASFVVPLFLGDIAHKDVEESEIWQPYTPKILEKHLKAGKIVFVDVTADWCLTCKANEMLVLDTEEIRKLLTGDNVVALKADWTNSDPDITAFIRSFGKFGIPLYVIYGPKIPKGKVLPEVLTPGIVKDAFKRARE